MPSSPCLRPLAAWLPGGLCTLLLLLAPAAAQPPVERKLALLIGCTEYKHLPDKTLRGPKNDVREFSKTLVGRFGFPAADVRSLVGWPDAEPERPTRENILRELDRLAEEARENMQVLVYFSGHGTRLPIPETQDPQDPKNYEPDGYDEAFVAADAKTSAGKTFNLISDNEIGAKLAAIRTRGAHVWAIFDCCHSGTMSRGAGDDPTGEQSRELTPHDLGIEPQAIQKTEARAAAGKSGGGSRAEDEQLTDLDWGTTDQKGSLVTFYAAQPFETAPDLPCPANAPKTADHYFGLLTYSLLQTLIQQRPEMKLSYRELSQAVISRYRAERGTRGPTPSFAGNLDREVLGLRAWPGRSPILLQPNGADWSLTGGELQGLAVDSILALFPPGSSDHDAIPLGYVRIVRTTPTSSQVVPCEFQGTAAVPARNLKAFMRCEVVSRQLGDLRLSVTIQDAAGELKSVSDSLRQTLTQPGHRLADFIRVTDDSAGDWTFVLAAPAQARQEFQLEITAPRLLLVRTGETTLTASAGDNGATRGPPLQKIWRQYDPADAAALAASVEADLMKIFTWQNLLRAAGRMRESSSDPACDVSVELASLDGPEDRSGGKPMSRPILKHGDFLELRVTNRGTDRVWASLIFLDADFRISVLPTQQLNKPGLEGESLQPIRFQVTGKTAGPQSWLVIATSAEADRLEPDYRFLAQSPLGKTPKPLIARERASGSPFESLALAIAGRAGASRGGLTPSAKNPTLVLRSWVAEPAENSVRAR